MRVELDIDIPEELAGDLREIADERGRPCSPDEVKRLAAKLAAVRRASGDDDAPAPDRDGMLARSVRVGDVVLHSPTYAAGLAQRRLMAWNAADPDLFDQDAYDVCEAYILAHAYDRGALARLTTPDEAAHVTTAWGTGLTCTPDELRTGLEALSADAYPESVWAGGGKGDTARAVDALLRRYGGSPDAWLYAYPSSLLAHLADAANLAEAEVARKHAKAQGEPTSPEDDPKFLAVSAYDEAVEQMKEGGSDG